MIYFKRILLSFILVLGVAVSMLAKDVDYWHRPLSSNGCHVTFSVSQENEKYYIYVTIESPKLSFVEHNTMLIRTYSDEVLKFEGGLVNIEQSSQTAYMNMNSMIIPISSSKQHSTARFEATIDQFNLLQKGISKIRLSTQPFIHEKEFGTNAQREKIGEGIYLLYLEAKRFEDDF